MIGPVSFFAALITALVLGAGGGQSPVVSSIRRWLGSLSLLDYAIGLLGVLIGAMVTLVTGLVVGAIAGLILGAVAGAGFHFLLVVPTRRGSADVIERAERFIRDLRIDGADEDGVRLFAARYGGSNWQRLFESLFGYDALCKVREQLKGDPSFKAS